MLRYALPRGKGFRSHAGDARRGDERPVTRRRDGTCVSRACLAAMLVIEMIQVASPIHDDDRMDFNRHCKKPRQSLSPTLKALAVAQGR